MGFPIVPLNLCPNTTLYIFELTSKIFSIEDIFTILLFIKLCKVFCLLFKKCCAGKDQKKSIC